MLGESFCIYLHYNTIITNYLNHEIMAQIIRF